jgi:hypothetical protein
MKSKMNVVVFFLLACATAGQAGATALPSACGDDKIQFDVKTQKAEPASLTPEPGKALVVLIETIDGSVPPWDVPSTRFAIDGTWIGANRGNSYFVISVTPGAHNVCSGWQGSFSEQRDRSDMSPLTAEAGKVYFFESKVKWTGRSGSDGAFRFKQITDDQGRFRVKASKLSSWTPKM